MYCVSFKASLLWCGNSLLESNLTPWLSNLNNQALNLIAMRMPKLKRVSAKKLTLWNYSILFNFQKERIRIVFFKKGRVKTLATS
jgi:hypothetical protein